MTEKEKLIGAIENLAWYHNGARCDYEAYVKYDDVLKTINEAIHEDEGAWILRQFFRICKIHQECKECPILEANEEKTVCAEWTIKHASEAAEIIRKLAKEHPEVKTRQGAFLKLFPKANTFNGVLDICPNIIGEIPECNYKTLGNCYICRKANWLAPAEEGHEKENHRFYTQGIFGLGRQKSL